MKTHITFLLILIMITVTLFGCTKEEALSSEVLFDQLSQVLDDSSEFDQYHLNYIVEEDYPLVIDTNKALKLIDTYLSKGGEDLDGTIGEIRRYFKEYQRILTLLIEASSFSQEDTIKLHKSNLIQHYPMIVTEVIRDDSEGTYYFKLVDESGDTFTYLLKDSMSNDFFNSMGLSDDYNPMDLDPFLIFFKGERTNLVDTRTLLEQGGIIEREGEYQDAYLPYFHERDSFVNAYNSSLTNNKQLTDLYFDTMIITKPNLQFLMILHMYLDEFLKDGIHFISLDETIAYYEDIKADIIAEYDAYKLVLDLLTEPIDDNGLVAIYDEMLKEQPLSAQASVIQYSIDGSAYADFMTYGRKELAWYDTSIYEGYPEGVIDYIPYSVKNLMVASADLANGLRESDNFNNIGSAGIHILRDGFYEEGIYKPLSFSIGKVFYEGNRYHVFIDETYELNKGEETSTYYRSMVYELENYEMDMNPISALFVNPSEKALGRVLLAKKGNQIWSPFGVAKWYEYTYQEEVDVMDPKELNSAGMDFYKEGELEMAAALFYGGIMLDSISSNDSQVAMCYYNHACTLSLLISDPDYSNIDELITYLERSFILRPDRIARAKEDSDFDNVRNTNEFISLLNRYE